MRLKLTLFVTLLCMVHLTYAQQDWAIRTNAGIASKAQFADGYYFSFDIGIPITRYLQIAPTFSFASIHPGDYMENSFTSDNDLISYGMLSPNDPRRDDRAQEILGSVSLLVLINPLKLFKDRDSRHELWIGTGYGYKSYIQARSYYRNEGQDMERKSFYTKANNGFAPYNLKLMYNYAFHEKLFGGLVIGMDGYDGEVVTNTGLQFGVRF